MCSSQRIAFASIILILLFLNSLSPSFPLADCALPLASLAACCSLVRSLACFPPSFVRVCVFARVWLRPPARSLGPSVVRSREGSPFSFGPATLVGCFCVSACPAAIALSPERPHARERRTQSDSSRLCVRAEERAERAPADTALHLPRACASASLCGRTPFGSLCVWLSVRVRGNLRLPSAPLRRRRRHSNTQRNRGARNAASKRRRRPFRHLRLLLPLERRWPTPATPVKDQGR